MERVINNELQPLVLGDGTIIPAAGTSEAREPSEVELSAADRVRLVDTGRLTLVISAKSQAGVGDGGASVAVLAPPVAAPDNQRKVGGK